MRHVWLATGLAFALLSACSPFAADDTATETRPHNPHRSIEPATVAVTLSRLDEFSVIRRLLQESGKQAVLTGPGPITLLAPRDTAFARMGPEATAALSDPAARQVLTRAISDLILPRTLRGEDLRTLITEGGGQFVSTTTGGTRVTFTVDGPLLVVTAANGARATMGTEPVSAGNGVVYVLDRWLGPGGDPPARR